MNLARHAAVLWRYRVVTATGIFLGVLLALAASYKITTAGLEKRGMEVWSATSQILVTQPGFPEGRVTLPEKQIDDAVTSNGGRASKDMATPNDQVEFADPARLAALGDLYSKFLTSDEVLRRVPERPTFEQVMASPFASSQGGLLLPVIELKTMAPSGERAHAMNRNTYKALLAYLEDRQQANRIPAARRVELKMIVQPSVALVSGAKPTGSVLVFLLVMLGTVAFTHLLEALRSRRQHEAMEALVHMDADELEVERAGERLKV